ncbi:ion transporter [Aquimarina sp. AD10]|uniref:ion transporter n=1 Tax=Aquimarina TaxID=290174 RepID=UPI000AF45539|nr:MULTISPECIES: ion transporter [Aquimarina]AXT63512.1 ion transporter [Aquimarina sp. AD10]RKM99770.1 ion transporter [Aquimarina sp. AD10]
MKNNSSHKTWKDKLHDIIYEADTPIGKAFDVILLILILLSIIFVMLESVKGLTPATYRYLYYAEWVITIFFSFEYIARIVSIKQPSKYIFSFYGIIDLLSTLPLYLTFFITGSSALLAVRALRLLRIFRILKISRYIGESNKLAKAIKDSGAKILVFLFAVLVLCIILGTVMYLVEGEESGFKSIPISVYWCIVTLTTVGYGDIAPATPLGQLIAAMIMIVGYGIIAVPTGIVSAEYASSGHQPKKVNINTQVCSNCNASDHRDEAKFCRKCGEDLRNE